MYCILKFLSLPTKAKDQCQHQKLSNKVTDQIRLDVNLDAAVAASITATNQSTVYSDYSILILFRPVCLIRLFSFLFPWQEEFWSTQAFAMTQYVLCTLILYLTEHSSSFARPMLCICLLSMQCLVLKHTIFLAVPWSISNRSLIIIGESSLMKVFTCLILKSSLHQFSISLNFQSFICCCC